MTIENVSRNKRWYRSFADSTNRTDFQPVCHKQENTIEKLFFFLIKLKFLNIDTLLIGSLDTVWAVSVFRIYG